MPARSPRRALAAALLAALAASAAALPAAALEPPAEWAAVAGAGNVLDDDQVTGLAGVEARWDLFRLPLGRRHLPIEPALGLTGNGDGGTYAYLSFRLDLAETAAALTGGEPPPPGAERRWRLIGYTGLGHYRPGDDGRELGGPLEFRSGLELSRRLGPRSRLGLSFDHLSNAGVYESNPGSESLVLVWSLATERLRPDAWREPARGAARKERRRRRGGTTSNPRAPLARSRGRRRAGSTSSPCDAASGTRGGLRGGCGWPLRR